MFTFDIFAVNKNVLRESIRSVYFTSNTKITHCQCCKPGLGHLYQDTFIRYSIRSLRRKNLSSTEGSLKTNISLCLLVCKAVIRKTLGGKSNVCILCRLMYSILPQFFVVPQNGNTGTLCFQLSHSLYCCSE